MAETATLSSKFQISIPNAIRKANHWEAGLTFAFIPKGSGELLMPRWAFVLVSPLAS